MISGFPEPLFRKLPVQALMLKGGGTGEKDMNSPICGSEISWS